MKDNNEEKLKKARNFSIISLVNRNKETAKKQKELEMQLAKINKKIREYGKSIAEGNEEEKIDKEFPVLTSERKRLEEELKSIKEERKNLQSTFRKIGVGVLSATLSAMTIAGAYQLVDVNTQQQIDDISNLYSQSHEAGYEIDSKNVSTPDTLNLLKMQLSNKITEITGEAWTNVEDIKINDNSTQIDINDGQASPEYRGKTITDVTVSVKGKTMFKYKSISSIAGGDTTYEKDNNMPEDMLKIIKLIVADQKRGENNRTTASEKAIIRKISNLGNNEDNGEILQNGIRDAYDRFKAVKEEER